ncbi:unnamed protein product, partial [Prorocentrum cordatum]
APVARAAPRARASAAAVPRRPRAGGPALARPADRGGRGRRHGERHHAVAAGGRRHFLAAPPTELRRADRRGGPGGVRAAEAAGWALNGRYAEPGFQRLLWEAVAAAGEDESRQRPRGWLAPRPIQDDIARDFGLESVEQALQAAEEEQGADRWVVWRRRRRQLLLSPREQCEGNAFSHLDAPPPPPGPGLAAAAGGAAAPEAERARAEGPPEGLLGYTPRPAESGCGGWREAPAARACPCGRATPRHEQRLSIGAEVEEIARKGDSLMYRLRSGWGPDRGWVSVTSRGAALLEPVRQDLELF